VLLNLDSYQLPISRPISSSDDNTRFLSSNSPLLAAPKLNTQMASAYSITSSASFTPTGLQEVVLLSIQMLIFHRRSFLVSRNEVKEKTPESIGSSSLGVVKCYNPERESAFIPGEILNMIRAMQEEDQENLPFTS